MNGCLLDTVVVLRLLLAPEKLSMTAAKAIRNAETELFYSPVNLWEIGIKMSVGGYLDLTVPDDWEIQFSIALKDNNIERTEIEPDDCKRVQHLSFHHRDPFDRMLIAQALARGLDMISPDQAFDDYGVRRVW